MDNIQYDMPLLLNKINKNFCKECDSYLKEIGLSKLHAFYLLCLFHNMQGIKLTELSQLVGCDKANTSRVVNDLENKNIVVRENSNQIKKYVIKLTDFGKSICEDFAGKMRERFRKMFECLTNEETKQFFGLLEKMIKGVDL